MIIANPIYDIVFKELINNTRIARFFIETLIDEQVIDLQPKPQEFQKTVDIETIQANRDGLQPGTPGLLTTVTVYRLDYIATILTADGVHKKVLIEVQKARNTVDVMRFRNYLAAQYMVEDVIQTKGGPEKKALPIITIYLLGFLLPTIEDAVAKIERNCIGVRRRVKIEKKSEFIEQLTHDAYFVQLKRITEWLPQKGEKLTKLEELMAVFEQKFFLDVRGAIKNYSYEIVNPEIKAMLEILEYMAANVDMRKEIEDEIKLWQILDGGSGVKIENFESKLEWKDKELKESKKALDENKKALDEKDKALDENKKALDENKKALDENKKALDENKKAIDEKDKELEQNKKALEDALKELAEFKRMQGAKTGQ